MRHLATVLVLAACALPGTAASEVVPPVQDAGPIKPDHALPLVGRSARSDTFRPRSPGGRSKKAWKKAKRGGKR